MAEYQKHQQTLRAFNSLLNNKIVLVKNNMTVLIRYFDLRKVLKQTSNTAFLPLWLYPLIRIIDAYPSLSGLAERPKARPVGVSQCKTKSATAETKKALHEQWNFNVEPCKIQLQLSYNN